MKTFISPPTIINTTKAVVAPYSGYNLKLAL